jgi:hypothetical protein
MKLILTTLFIVVHLVSRSQVAISYFPIQSILSISSNTERLLWAEYKIETNTFFTNLNMEISPKINIKKTDWANYYVGPGASFNPSYGVAELGLINGYFLDLGARIKPIQKHKSVHLVFEISPYVNRTFDGGNLRTRLGVSYNFLNKRKDKITE